MIHANELAASIAKAKRSAGKWFLRTCVVAAALPVFILLFQAAFPSMDILSSQWPYHFVWMLADLFGATNVATRYGLSIVLWGLLFASCAFVFHAFLIPLLRLYRAARLVKRNDGGVTCPECGARCGCITPDHSRTFLLNPQT